MLAESDEAELIRVYGLALMENGASVKDISFARSVHLIKGMGMQPEAILASHKNILKPVWKRYVDSQYEAQNSEDKIEEEEEEEEVEEEEEEEEEEESDEEESEEEEELFEPEEKKKKKKPVKRREEKPSKKNKNEASKGSSKKSKDKAEDAKASKKKNTQSNNNTSKDTSKVPKNGSLKKNDLKRSRVDDTEGSLKERVKLMKMNSEPVWKQAKSREEGNRSSKGAITAPKEESRIERATRLTSLLEKFTTGSSLNVASAIKTMNKLKAINMNLDELLKSRAASVVSDLRKHSEREIAVVAKDLRSHWKQSAVVNPDPITSSSCSEVNQTKEDKKEEENGKGTDVNSTKEVKKEEESGKGTDVDNTKEVIKEEGNGKRTDVNKKKVVKKEEEESKGNGILETSVVQEKLVVDMVALSTGTDAIVGDVEAKEHTVGDSLQEDNSVKPAANVESKEK